MALRAALRELSEVVGRMESEGYVVTDVTSTDGSLLTGQSIAVDLSVYRPLDETIASATCAEIDVDGCPDQSAIPATISITIDLEAAEASSQSIPGAVASGVPAHDDPVALRRAYENYETFKEMTDALDVEVSPSTVRRHMIKHGIHEPEPMVSEPDDAGQPIQVGANGSNTAGGTVVATDQTGATESTPSIETRPLSDPVEVSTTAEASPDESGVLETGPDQVQGTPERDRESSASPTDDEDNEDSVEVTANDSPVEDQPVHPPEHLDLDVETKRIVTDGIGLPEHLTLEDVIDVVEGSSTLFEARREMDVDQDRARRILQTLDLLDLVSGRLSRHSEREVSRGEIAERIRNAIQVEAAV